MKHVYKTPTSEQQERHRTLRELADREKLDLISHDQLRRQLRSLATHVQTMLDYVDRGELPPAELTGSTREDVNRILSINAG